MWEPKRIFKYFPVIEDLVRFTKLKIKAQICGTNSAAMTLLNDVSQASRMYYRRVEELAKLNMVLEESEKAKLEGNLDKARNDAVDAYTSFLNSIRTGREMEDTIRYNSMDVLTSVLERLQNLKSSGIFNPETPPFDQKLPIWRYDIKHLEISVQKMLVDLVCTKIFERAMQRGFQDDVIEVIVVDEGKRYATDEEGNILKLISNEARKFGLGLWIASQSPEHFDDDFLKSTGTIMVLGLSAADSRMAATKLGLTDPEMLNRIQPQKTALIQIKNIGELNSSFQLIELTD
jgi:DNA helicase HerA-like ATPase